MKYALIVFAFLTLSYEGQGQNTSPWPATGNVGIGTTTPGGKALYVRANSNGDHSSVIENASSTGYGLIVNSANDPLRVGPLGDYNGSYFKIAGNGNIGIGTSNPGNKIDVSVNGMAGLNVFGNSSAYIGSDINISRSSTTGSVGRGATLQFNDSGSGSYNIIQGSSEGLQFFNLYGGSSWIERMRITPSGNIGIGTSTPATNLHIGNTNGGGIRIGAAGDAGNISVAVGAQTIQYNLDFSGYRDVSPDQIGARISALRFNGYLTNSAYKQTTGLAFYTNPSGHNSGIADLQERMRISPEGNVGIGTTNPTQKLTVNGTIYGKEVKVDLNVPGPDYVFANTYQLLTLNELKSYIDQNKHLPEVPSAAALEANGINLGEMNMLLLKKIEELTLYLIEQNKIISKQNERISNLENKR